MSSTLKPIRCTVSDQKLVNRIEKLRARRKDRKATRTFRDLALERAKQIEDYGDVPMVPGRFDSERTSSASTN